VTVHLGYNLKPRESRSRPPTSPRRPLAPQSSSAPSLRRAAKRAIPPVAVDLARGLLARLGRAEWTYLPRGWPSDPIGGWDVESVVEAQLSRWSAFAAAVQQPACLGRSPESANLSSEQELGAHNTAMAFAYVLSRAGADRKRLSMLDWGGGLGQYAVLARALAPSLELEYHCRDLPLIASAGRTVLPHDSFHDTDASAFSREYDLVVASSSLQYVRDWRDTLRRLALCARDYLYVTRQPFVFRTPSFVVLQRPHRHGYRTEYPGWFLNRGDFLDAAAGSHLKLEREFLIWERPFVAKSPEKAEYRGFLFSPAARVEL
jgi:putative methyltransferase (TIGR04325 family)